MSQYQPLLIRGIPPIQKPVFDMIMQTTVRPVDIIYGTVTGNAQALAERFADHCDRQAIPCTLNAAEDWSMERFGVTGRNTVFVFSTWGDGEPPDDAIDFCETLYDQKVPVAHLRYAVVALGDSAYDDYCGCGRRLDEALSRAGATRLLERVDLDVDFDDEFDAWMKRFFILVETGRTETNVTSSHG